MNKEEALEYLNRFYEDQYNNSYDNYNPLLNWLRYNFGWFQDPKVTALNTYLKNLVDDAEVDPARLRALLPTSSSTAMESTATERTPLTSKGAANSAVARTLDQLLAFINELLGVIEKTSKTREAKKKARAARTRDLTKDKAANLKRLPQKATATPNLEVTLGDLHGNTLKLVYFLIREGAITGITASDYANLARIYGKSVSDLTEGDLQQFRQIINKITLPTNPAERVKLIRLIGDVLADRGQNDYFTLLILKKLSDIGLAVEIELSNHDFGFLKCFGLPAAASTAATFETDYFSRNHAYLSSLNLVALLNRDDWPSSGFGETLRTEVAEALIAYRRSLKLVGYTLSPDQEQIAIYTHAPVGLETIRQLADFFGVTFRNGTARELASTIDQINSAGIEQILALKPEGLMRLLFSPAIDRLIWARYNGSSRSSVTGLSGVATTIDRPYCHVQEDGSFYTLSFVHGHTEGEASSHVYNLDSILGKIPTLTTGLYLSYHSTSQAAPAAGLLPPAAPVVAAVSLSPALGAPALEATASPAPGRDGDGSESRMPLAALPLVSDLIREAEGEDSPTVAAAPATHSAHGAELKIDLARKIHSYIRKPGEAKADEDETTPPSDGFRGF